MVVEGFNILFSSIGVMMAVSLIAVAYQFPLEEMPGLRQLLGLICGGVVRAPSPRTVVPGPILNPLARAVTGNRLACTPPGRR